MGLAQAGLAQAGPEQTGPEQTGPEQTGPEQTGPEQTGLGPEAKSRVRSVNRIAIERARVGYMPNGWILRSAKRSGNPSLLAECLLTQATAFACSGYPKEARSVLGEVQTLLRDGAMLDRYWSWRYQNTAGIVADDFAELRETWTHHQESLRIALESGVVDLVATSRLNLGYLAIRMGMYGEALVQLMEIVATDGMRAELFIGTHLMVSRLFHEQGDAELAWHHRQLAEERGGRSAGFEHSRLLLDMTALTTDLYDANWLVEHVRRVRAFSETTGSELARLEASLYEAKIHHGAGDTSRAISEVRTVVERCPDGLAIKPLATLTLAGFLVEGEQFVQAIVLLEGAVLSPAPAMLSYRVAELRSVTYQNLGRWRDASACLDELDELSNARTQDVLAVVEFQKASHNADQLARQNDLLRLKNLELESLHRDKEAIMNMVANDFQSPLTALQLSLHFLRSDPSSSNLERHVDTALRTIARVEVSAEQLSLAGEIEHGSLSCVTSPFQLVPFLRSLRDSVNQREPTQPVELVLAQGSDVTVESDEERVRQIFESLFNGVNALSGTGSRLVLRSAVQESLLLLRVDAPELMVSDDLLARMNQSWGTDVPATLPGGSDPDLSFYIAERICEHLGCTLEIRPLAPRGAVFSLLLPIGDPYTPDAILAVTP